MRLSTMVALALVAPVLATGTSLAHEQTMLRSGRAADLAAEVRAAVHAQTKKVLDLVTAYRGASDSMARHSALRDLVSAASAREDRLAALIEERPGEVLQAAIAASVREALPPEVKAHIEEEVSLEGELDVLHADYDTGGRYIYWLRIAGTRLSVHFAAAPTTLRTGDRVRLRALRVRQALAVGQGATVLAAAGPLSSTMGPQKTAVFLVAFQDQPSVTSSTLEAAQHVMFDAPYSVSNFLYQSSYQQTWLTGNVFGPYVVPYNSGTCNYNGIANAAESAAAQDGINLSGYVRRVYAFPSSSGCGWGGLGTLGGVPSKAWINGRSAAYNGLHPGTVSHELGHNFGLYHSHALECGSVVMGGGSCSSIEYGDTLDVMGLGSLNQFNAAQKERLGWLNWQDSPPMTEVTTAGTYSIDPFEPPGTGAKALKIPVGGDAFYVEYRQTSTSDTNVSSGVVVHFVDNQHPNSIYLLDMTPSTSSWFDPALAVGKSFTDGVSKLTITPLAVNGAGATVSVSFGGGGTTSCVRRNPTLAVSPANQQGGPSVARTYTVAVTNNDTGCTASSFRQKASLPSGWAGSFGTSMLSINASATVSTTLTVQPPASVSAGSFTISPQTENASLPSYAASASATYAVAGGGGTGSFTDNFDRANADHPGPSWTVVNGKLAVQGEQLRSAASRALHIGVVNGLIGATQHVSARFGIDAGNGGGPRLGVIVRYQGPGDYYACYRQTGGASVLRIARVVNGQERVLKAVSVPNPASNGSWTLGCRAQSSTLTLEFNGADRVTVSDSTFAQGGMGVQMGYGTTSGPSVSLRADDFSAAAP